MINKVCCLLLKDSGASIFDIISYIAVTAIIVQCLENTVAIFAVSVAFILSVGLGALVIFYLKRKNGKE